MRSVDHHRWHRRGHRDATIEALVECAALIAHGIALQPGRTAAVGKLGSMPVVALRAPPITRWRRGGALLNRCLIACAAARRDSGSCGRWRARLPPASA